MDIKQAKQIAKTNYLKMQDELKTVTCGISMLCDIRPSFAKLVKNYDEAIIYLKTNDPEFPRGE